MKKRFNNISERIFIMDKLNVAVIGLGSRGHSIIEHLLLGMSKITITAVCDTYPDRAERSAKTVYDKTGKMPFYTTDYKEILTKSDVDAVLVITAWESHVEIAIAAMESGKAVGMEVGGAYTVDDCFALVDAYERTKTPFMFLENCCYGRNEMMVMNMVKQGLFGKIVHCSGGYQHDLRDEIAKGNENRHYRLRNYLSRNCENYPTHELGPIAQVLDINRGNRMVSLVSMASSSLGLNDFASRTENIDPALITAEFAQGDVVNTLIKCAGGETILLTLDTTLPRYYSRGFTVRGTKGMYTEDNHSIFIDGKEEGAHHWNWRPKWGCADNYRSEYEHPVWKEYLEKGVFGGHGGMDGLVYGKFFECLLESKPMPIDVYDAAAWMAVTPLSEESIKKGSVSVDFPDFTHGEWKTRK